MYQVGVGLTTGLLTVVETRVYDETTSGTQGIGNGKVTRVERETGVTGDATRKTWYFYDWRDRLTTQIITADAGSPSPRYRVTKYTYDDLDHTLIKEVYDSASVSPPTSINPLPAELRNREENKYDSLRNIYENRMYAVNQSSGASVSTQYIATRLWYDQRNIRTKQRTNDSVLSKTEVDGLGRSVRSVVSYDDSGEGGWGLDFNDDTVIEEAVFAYDMSGNLLDRRTYYRTRSATGAGLLSSLPASNCRLSAFLYWYDSLDRQTHAAHYGNSPPVTRPATAPPYTDPIALISQRTYDNAGRIVELKSPEEKITHYEYDGISRVSRITENYVPGGTANDNNRVRDITYDEMNRIKQEIATTAAGTTPGVPIPQKTEYVYGVIAGPESTINSNDLLYMIKYPDPTTGLPSISTQDQNKFGYNRQGDLIWRKDQNGTEHKYKRDVEGRMTEDYLYVIGSGVDNFVQSLRTTYDGFGRPLTVTSWSAPSSGGGGVGRNAVAFAYGDYGHITKVTQNPTGSSTTGQPYVEYTYQYPDYALGIKTLRLASTRYPNGTFYFENYTNTTASFLSRPNGKTTAYVEALFTERYEGLNRVVERELGSATGTLYTRTPDAYGRVQEIKLAGGSFGTTTTNSTDYWYCYNRNSQVTFREDLVRYGGSFSESYQYDGLSRLIEFKRGLSVQANCVLSTTVETQTWTTLDHSNNWGSQYGHTVNRSNELTSELYDNNGNFGAYPGQKAYDAWNRLVSITQSGFNYGTFRYNALNQLVSQVTAFSYYNHSNDQYLYGAGGRLLEERAWNGYGYSTKKHCIWGYSYLDELVAIWQYSTNTFEYVIQDANWNTATITNGTSSIKERYRYKPYGTTTKLTANWASTAPIYDDIPLYSGQRYNWLNGLYNYKNRYHDPTRGRFYQRDPKRLWHDVVNFGNAYSYVGDDPINLTDPKGLFVCVSFDKTESGARAAKDFFNLVSGCGLSLTSAKDPLCNCCKKSATQETERIEMKQTRGSNAPTPPGLERVVNMINDKKRGFCLEMMPSSKKDDAYQRKEDQTDTPVNPGRVTTRTGPVEGSTNQYRRTACALVVHMFGENFWGARTNEDYEYAHGDGLAEENWYRGHQASDNEPIESGNAQSAARAAARTASINSQPDPTFLSPD